MVVHGGSVPGADPETEFYYTQGRLPYSDEELSDWIEENRPGPTTWDGDEYNEEVADDDENPNYQCQVCGRKANIDDHRRHAAAWCESDECDQIRNHERLD